MDAIRRTLFRPRSLRAAIDQLGFVQADPIRSPARAQDLILRHRVKDYHAGDLERCYPRLGIEEGFLYAYGFVSRWNRELLHPGVAVELSAFEARVLEVVRAHGRMHPKDLEQHLGRERTVNAWGGYSKATTHALHGLQRSGLIRVVERVSGIRIYQAAGERADVKVFERRPRDVLLLLVQIFAPVPVASLRQMLGLVNRGMPGMALRARLIDEMLDSGEIESGEAEGVAYVWPAGTLRAAAVPEAVRFLAPFDPLVWDRRRFRLFWGWEYRFEAYTPAAKRERGYYAMPLLWLDRIIGWANVRAQNGKVSVELGFVDKRPDARAFRLALDAEIARIKSFLRPRPPT